MFEFIHRSNGRIKRVVSQFEGSITLQTSAGAIQGAVVDTHIELQQQRAETAPLLLNVLKITPEAIKKLLVLPAALVRHIHDAQPLVGQALALVADEFVDSAQRAADPRHGQRQSERIRGEVVRRPVPLAELPTLPQKIQTNGWPTQRIDGHHQVTERVVMHSEAAIKTM